MANDRFKPTDIPEETAMAGIRYHLSRNSPTMFRNNGDGTYSHLKYLRSPAPKLVSA